MGVTVRRPKGKKDYYVHINFEKRRKSKKIGSRKKAEAVAEEIRAQIATGAFAWKDQMQITPTFREMSEQWLSGYIANNCKESSSDTYCGILKKHLLPIFSNKSIDAITRADFRAFLVDKIKQGKSKATVRLCYNVTNGIIDEAIESGWININPLAGILKKLWTDNSSREIEDEAIFNKVELDNYLAAAATIEPEILKVPYLLFFTAATTGMRSGEISALQWKDVNLSQGYILVRRSYRQGRLTRPKNHKTRKVDMSDELIAAFKAELVAGYKDVNALVFSNNGKPFEQYTIIDAHKRILKAAGLRYRKFHALRHSFASLLLNKGVNLFYVSKQLGHSSIQITSDIYGHFEQKKGNRLVNLLDLNATNCNQTLVDSVNARQSSLHE